MKTLLLYDSVFGNTQKVALAMSAVFSDKGPCESLRPDQFQRSKLEGVGRLVVGSPTRAFRPTPALVAALKALPPGSLAGIDVLAFDTRAWIERAPKVLRFFARLFGYAADPLARLLQKKGGRLVLPPAGFVVLDTEGPLRAGEIERAVAWARSSDAPPAAR